MDRTRACSPQAVMESVSLFQDISDGKALQMCSMCVVFDRHIAKKDGLGNCNCDFSFMQKDLTEQKLGDKCVKEKNRDLASVCDQLNDKELSSGTDNEGQHDLSNSKNNSEEKVRIHQVKAGSSFV